MQITGKGPTIKNYALIYNLLSTYSHYHYHIEQSLGGNQYLRDYEYE